MASSRLVFVAACAFIVNLSVGVAKEQSTLQHQEGATLCVDLTRGLRQQGGQASINQKLAILVAGTADDIQSLNASSLLKKIHPRLKHSLSDIDKILQRMKFVLGTPHEPSVYKFWRVSNPTTQTTTPLSCGDHGEFHIFPHYGMAEHYIAWLQILGPKEVGRVFLTLVPEKETYKIGFLNFHKWTHMEKSFKEWIIAGNESIALNPAAAYLKYDIASKLMNGNPHLKFVAKEKLQDAIKGQFAGLNWLSEKISSDLGSENIAAAESLFTLNGVGLSLKMTENEKPTGDASKKDCEAKLAGLKKLKWFSEFSGVKCSFYSIKDDLDGPARFGSIFLHSH